MYKAVSDSVETHEIINCIVQSIILNYIICIIKVLMSSEYAGKHLQQSHKICTEKHFVVQHFVSDNG